LQKISNNTMATKKEEKVKTKTVVKEKIAEKPKNKGKCNMIVSYNKIDNALKLELSRQYPDGYANYVHRYPKPNGESFFAVPLDTKDANYLIKVEVKIDNLITEDDFDKHFGDISEVVDTKTISETDVGVSSNDDDEEEETNAQANVNDDDDE